VNEPLPPSLHVQHVPFHIFVEPDKWKRHKLRKALLEAGHEHNTRQDDVTCPILCREVFVVVSGNSSRVTPQKGRIYAHHPLIAANPVTQREIREHFKKKNG
jgi:hypothetical protein